MTPYYEHAGITIYHGDCREVLPTLEFSVVVTDPPYGRAIELSRRNGERIQGDVDTELRDWLVSATSSPMLIFGSPLISRPRGYRSVLIWDKSELTGMGDLGLPWKLTHEEIYVFGDGYVASPRRGSILRFPRRPHWTRHPEAVSNDHPTEKPLGLMMYLLSCCPRGVIADPFMGIGTTLVAAKHLGRPAIGIEIEERYCEIAARRLSQEVMELS